MCETPLHTIEILRKEIERAPESTRGEGGAQFVKLDTRVLTWLCADAERLNKLDSRAIGAGLENADAFADRYGA